MNHKTLAEVPRPYHLLQSSGHKPILLGKSRGYYEKETERCVAVGGIAMIPFYLTEPGQDLTINLNYCISCSVLTDVEAQYWLDTIVIHTAKHDLKKSKKRKVKTI